jgi:hypothetical protein
VRERKEILIYAGMPRLNSIIFYYLLKSLKKIKYQNLKILQFGNITEFQIIIFFGIILEIKKGGNLVN